MVFEQATHHHIWRERYKWNDIRKKEELVYWQCNSCGAIKDLNGNVRRFI